MININNIKIKDIIEIAKKAGASIMQIYSQSDFGIETKTDNENYESPLTKADKTAHKIIEKELQKYNLPILSEEGEDVSYEKRKKWKKFWLVDPLDGTKEFVSRNGNFTVNIALIENNKAVMGVVYVPAKDICYWSDGNTSYKDGEKISYSKQGDKLRVVASKNHLNQETKDYINKLGNIDEDIELVSIGSSLKLCLVAEGKADIYPRLGPTMEWDTAAAHAIVNTSGKRVYEYNSKQELIYNKQDLHNPWFVVE